MFNRLRIPIPALALLLATGPLIAQGPGAPRGREERDDALRRAKAEAEWFGGRPSIEFLDHKNRQAAREFQRWRGKLPGFKGTPGAAAATADPAWVNLGPTAGKGQSVAGAAQKSLESGRPTAIVPHPTDPKILYLAVSGGGLWKCVDADLASSSDWTWTPITDSLPSGGSGTGNISLGGMDLDPANPNTLFIALGDKEAGSANSTADGKGFYISTDAGANWTMGGSLGNTTRVKTVFALTSQIIFVAGNDGLWRSTDGGLNFTQRLTGSAWEVVKLSATDLIASVGGTIHYSNNSGDTWTPATLDSTITSLSPSRITLAGSAASANQAWGICDTGDNVAKGLLKTTDGGKNWTFVPSPSSGSTSLFYYNGGAGDGGQGGYNHFIAVDPTDINKVFVGANLCLYRTTNGGTAWEQMTEWVGRKKVYAHADFHVGAWARTGTKTLFIGNDGGLCIVRDPDRSPLPSGSGAVADDTTFIDNSRNKGLATHMVYNLGSTTASNGLGRVTIGLQDNGSRLRMDGSSTTYDLFIGGDGFGTVIHPKDGNKLMGSLYTTRIVRSEDGATTTEDGSVGIAEAGDFANAPFYTRIALAPSDPEGNTVYTFTYKAIYKSTDFAKSWTGMPWAQSVTPRNLSGSQSNPGALAVVTNGGTGFVTYNGGSSWSQFGTLPNNGTSMSDVWFDPVNDQTLYASSVSYNHTKNHLWKSTNGGSAWTALDTAGSNLPDGIPIHVLKGDPSHANILYLGNDFGLYRSIDSGTTWSRFGTGLPLVAVRDIYVAPDGSFLRVGTHGRGVWELTTAPDTGTVYVNPASVTLPKGGTQQFTASVVGGGAVNWTASSGSIDATGKFTAPMNPGTFIITATNATNSSLKATASVFIPDVAVVLNPATISMLPGDTTTFTAMVTGTLNTGVDWTATGGTIDTTGKYTAPTASGTYQVKATSQDDNTKFATSGVTVATQLEGLVNPGFEEVAKGWKGSTGSIVDSTTSVGWGGIPARTGSYLAFVSGYGSAATDSLYQDVAITSKATSVSLSFWIQITTSETGSSANDVFKVQVRDTSGTVLETLASYSNLDKSTSWAQKTFDVTRYKGQAVRLYVEGTENASLATAFFLDDFALTIGGGPSAPSKDINGDAAIDAYDLLEFLKLFNSTAPADLAKADFNVDGQINDTDLTLLLSAL